MNLGQRLWFICRAYYYHWIEEKKKQERQRLSEKLLKKRINGYGGSSLISPKAHFYMDMIHRMICNKEKERTIDLGQGFICKFKLLENDNFECEVIDTTCCT